MNKFTDLNISRLGFGGMRFPYGGGKGGFDIELIKQMVDRYIEAGGNYFDTAFIYDGSEEAFKKALIGRHPRDSFYFADKLSMWCVKDKNDKDRFFNEQLERTGTDYFDSYLLHSIGGWSMKQIEEFDMLDYFRKLKESGKARHIGFSFHDSAEALDKFLTEVGIFEFAQLQINYLDWYSEKFRADRLHEVAVKHNIPIIVMEPVRGGYLSNLPGGLNGIFNGSHTGSGQPGTVVPTVSSWAIRFAASLPGVVTVLSGMSSMEQIDDNINSLMADFRPLSETEHCVIREVVESFKKYSTVPCTACNYCNICPNGVLIPEILKISNDHMINGDIWGMKGAYKKIDADKNAAACTECGACVPVCPQGIDIPAKIREIGANFDKDV